MTAPAGMQPAAMVPSPMTPTSKTDRQVVVTLGPFAGGLNNAAGSGENIDDKEVFSLLNLEVDLDGSLVNRPAIQVVPLSGFGSTTDIRVLGYYEPADQRKFLVCSIGTVIHLVDPTTGLSVANRTSITSTAVVQYADKLWVVPFPGTGSGGNFSVASAGATPTWTTVSAIPTGEAVIVYKERLWVACGLNATSNTSRLSFSAIGDGTTWNSSDFLDIEPGNGQKLVYMVVLNADIILFKQHSTFRYGYNTSPAKGDVTRLSTTIGVPSTSCAVTYDNNNVYVLHDNSVYELYNYSYTKISNQIALRQVPDNSLYATELYGLTLYRNRLFVRYYSYLYVYSLVSKTWSQWTTARKFSRIVCIPNADIGLDTAYASTASSDDPGKIYYFRDDRTTGVGVAEAFTCTVVTKSMDYLQGRIGKFLQYLIPTAYKALLWWGVSIATSGNTTASVTVPFTGVNSTWDYQKAHYTWDQAKAALLWDNSTSTMYSKTTAPTGTYSRKIIKQLKKLRFRQAYWTVATDAVSNNFADASVRIYEIILLCADRQTIVKETS